jgi:hypothetical protein
MRASESELWGERLEPRIVLHPGHHRARRHCGDRRRMRCGEQCDVGPSLWSGRAAVQDDVWHDQRRHDHRPVHGAIRPQPACPRNSRRLGPTCSARHHAADRAGSAERGGTKPSATGPDHGGQPHAAACSPTGAGAGRATARSARAAARTGRSDRLRHHRERTDHRSLHRDLRTPAQQRPIIT